MSGPWEDYQSTESTAAAPLPWEEYQPMTPSPTAQPDKRNYLARVRDKIVSMVRAEAQKTQGQHQKAALRGAANLFNPVGTALDLLPKAHEVVFPDKEEARTASGVVESLQAGWQGSATGLAVRGKLPSVTLDPHHAKWYEKLASTTAQTISELPEMVAGGLVVGAAGLPTGPGAVAAAGAGMFAVPTALRESLVQSYSMGEAASVADYLGRTSIVVKSTAKDALVGALTSLTGYGLLKVATPALEGAARSLTMGSTAAAGPLGSTASKIVTGGAQTLAATGEIGAMTVAPALLEGRLPERDDFLNAAILVGGMKGAHVVVGKLHSIYAKTGRTPAEVLSDAQSDPKLAEELRQTVDPAKPVVDPEIPDAYRPLADAQAAADAVPGIPQEVVKEFYGPTIPIPGEPKPTTIDYNYINSSEQVKGALERLSAVNEVEIQTQRRGAVSHEQTDIEAANWLRQNVGDGAEVTARQPGTAANAAELLARKQMTQEAANAMGERAQELLSLAPDAPPEAVAAAEAAFAASVARTQLISAEFLGARAEAGRALDALKITKKAAASTKLIQEMIAQGKSMREIAEMASVLDSPEAALKFAQGLSKVKTIEKVLEAWKASLVSGPITQMANFLGNVTFAGMRPVVDAAAAAVGTAARGADRVRFSEPVAGTLGSLAGVTDGLKLAKVAFMEDVPGGKAEHRHAIGGKTGYIVRTPFRALGAADQLFRTMNERYEAYSLAAREAVKEGHNPATREFRERVVELATNPTEAMIEKIDTAGERYTFQAKGGEIVQAMMGVLNAAPVLKFAVPFMQTPVNVFKEMARHSPAAPIVKEWRTAWAEGGAAKQKAIAEMMVGTGISALAASWTFSGHVSGAGDPDPNKRRAQIAAGWQPYSVKIGDTWYSYQRLQPLGTVIGMAADMAEAWEHMNPEEQDKVPRILGLAFANAVTNQTFLQGMSTLSDALSQPDRKGPRFVQNLAASAVPALVGQSAQLFDPYVREIGGIKDAVQNRIPGLREQLPTQRDPFGQPVSSPERLIPGSPVVMREQSTDKVRTELARLASLPESSLSVRPAPKAIHMAAGGDMKAGRVELTPEQRDRFAEASGQMAYQILSDIVHSPGYDFMPDFARELTFKAVFEHANQMGEYKALTPQERAVEIDRIVGRIQKRINAPGGR